MAENTKIEWCHYSFNSWWGCTKVSQGCKNCYAETLSNRWGNQFWGPTGQRRIMAQAYWDKPIAWNQKAGRLNERHRVFCASMADVFEAYGEVRQQEWLNLERSRLWRLIEQTPNLDWLLLTKRPENIANMIDARWRNGIPSNVWLGASVEDQDNADKRIPYLVQHASVVRFLSCEPLLGPVDILRWLQSGQINWVIVGGESGPGARPMRLAWVYDLVRQCNLAAVPVFVKQLGAAPLSMGYERYPVSGKGGDMVEWPEDLRVREFPVIEREMA